MVGSGKPRRPEVVAFDIVGTVFPLEPLRSAIVALGLPPSGLDYWFATGLRDAFALSAAGDFKPFSVVLRSALDQVLAEQGIAAPEEGRDALIDDMKRLPARSDARAAFETLAAGGVRIIAVSNGAASATLTLLEASGLESLVEQVLSVEEVKVFKPRREIYDHAVRMAKVAADRLALVAVHPWDINGAKAAGLTTAYVSVERPFPPIMRPPDVEAASLDEAARSLIEL